MDEKTRLDLYRVMVLSRTYEEAILREYHADKKPAFDIGAGLVPGEMHLSAGQEPVAAGVCAHLRDDDAVTATHRPHHIAIAHGVDLDRMTAEIFGRETGLGANPHLAYSLSSACWRAVTASAQPVTRPAAPESTCIAPLMENRFRLGSATSASTVASAALYSAASSGSYCDASSSARTWPIRSWIFCWSMLVVSWLLTALAR